MTRFRRSWTLKISLTYNLSPRSAVDTCGAVCSDERNNGVIRTISNSVFMNNGGQYCGSGGAIDSKWVANHFIDSKWVH